MYSFGTNTKKKRRRILCLHGAYSNNDISKIQISGLKLEQPDSECVYLQAPHKVTKCYPGLAVFSDGPWYAWSPMVIGGSKSPSLLWEESLEFLGKFLKENGPFDGVYGFSQGVAMITTFSHPRIWRDRFRFASCPWKFAILACGGGGGRMVPNYDEEKKINLPSLHVFGSRDSIQPESRLLASHWTETHKATYTHDGGHEIDVRILYRNKQLGVLLKEFLEKHS